MEEKKLYIPVILGTVRKGRMSEHAAKLVLSELAKREGVETELIDIAKMPLPIDDAGEAIKDPELFREDAARRWHRDRLARVQPRISRHAEACAG